MQKSPVTSCPERMETHLVHAMFRIIGNNQRLVEENALCFNLTDAMFFGILALVAVIPVKASDPLKV
jgi:hypothetical protein